MRVAIDRVGRLVVPKPLRDQVGLSEGGQVDVVVEGAGIRIEPVSGGEVVEEAGFLVIPPSGRRLTDDDVREIRLADQP